MTPNLQELSDAIAAVEQAEERLRAALVRVDAADASVKPYFQGLNIEDILRISKELVAKAAKEK